MKFNTSWLCKSCQSQKVDEQKIGKSAKGTLENEGNWFLQLFATISGGLSIMGFGTLVGWSSPSIPYLTSGDFEITISVAEGAWITSISNLGTVISYLIVPLIINRFGRKYSLLFFGTFQIISWIVLIFSKSFITLCSARIIAGFGAGGSMTVMSVYMGEIAEKRIRGMLSSCLVIFSDIGIFIVASTGAYFSYNTMNSVLLLIPILHVITFAFMPESPYFYLMIGRDEEAKKSLMRLRGLKKAEGLQSEIEEIKLALEEVKSVENNSLRQLFHKKSNLKAFVIVLCVSFAAASSGSIAMLAYAQEIFSYSGFSLTPAHSFMIVVAVKVISGLAVTQLIERVGRRILFLSSGVSCAIFLGTIGFYFFSKLNLKADVSSISWLPLMCLISFQIANALGLGPLLFVLIAEFFSMEVKQAAVPIIMTILCSISFSTELMFPLVNRSAGIFVSFWIFATCCFTGSVISFWIMPESKGKSLEQIQSILSSKKNVEPSGFDSF